MAPLINHCPVRWHAIYHSHWTALQYDQQSITYQQLDQLLSALQRQLLTQINLTTPISTSTPPSMVRLACIASNGIELLLMQLLCVRAGWLFCPLNPRFTATELSQRLAVLNTPYCWIENEQDADSLPTSSPQLQIDFELLLSNLHEQASSSIAATANISTSAITLTPLLIEPEQACNIIFTSGSSGFPKAIVHNYRNHFFSALGSQRLIPLAPQDHNLLSLPLFHIGGYATVLRTIITGACIHLTTYPLTVALLQQHRITHLSLVSTQLIRLLADPLFNAKQSAIKHVLLGGSAFSEEHLTALAARGFHYHLSYGSTEMASQIATSDNSSQLQVLPYREIKIHRGEIYITGETRFIGYFRDNAIHKIAAEEWVASGDLGTLKQHQLSIIGRKDRQFISGGENIQPEEIERVCLQYGRVKQAYICPTKDQQYGQRIALFVLFSDSTQFDLDCQQLKHYLGQQLIGFKQPDHYLAWPLKLANNQALKVPKQVFIDSLSKQGLT